MKTLKILFFSSFLAILFLSNSCKNGSTDASGWVIKDLLSEGVPLKILAPIDVKVKIGIENHYKKISLYGGKDYFIEILATESGSNDLKQIKNELLKEVKLQKNFSKIIEDTDYGFLFEKKKPDGNLSYDFRYLKSDGFQQFVFQTGMYSDFSLSQAKNMYQSLTKMK